MFIKSVDSIVSQFNKMVVELEKVVEKNLSYINVNNAAISKLEEDSSILRTEVERATTIKSKINSIIN